MFRTPFLFDTMPKFKPALSPNEPDPALLDLLDLFERICLTAVEVVALLSSSGWLISSLGRILRSSGDLMSPLDALCALSAAIGFQLSSPYLRASFAAAFHSSSLVASPSSAPLSALPNSSRSTFARAPHRPQLALQPPGQSMAAYVAALAFTLLGIVMVLIQSRRRLASSIADVLLIPLIFLALVLVSGHLFRFVEVPRSISGNAASPETLFCIAILSLVAVMRHAQSSVYAVFIGRGIAGRIARFLAPVLVLLPFLREGTRILFIGAGRISPSFFSAILASMASLLSLCLLLYIARRISSMESQIHELSIRDELTGLSNLRGFRLLAEQGLRMARRSHVPFSLLFIDVDNLKDINDTFGHTVGSNILSDTGKILIATFRESDVLGRVGGDEFAVAGNFSQARHHRRYSPPPRGCRSAQCPPSHRNRPSASASATSHASPTPKKPSMTSSIRPTSPCTTKNASKNPAPPDSQPSPRLLARHYPLDSRFSVSHTSTRANSIA
jgi:GGDEF domain-containing protein